MKKIVKDVIEHALYYFGIMSLILWWQSKFSSKIIILMYHQVAEQVNDFSQLAVAPRCFEQQMKYLKKYTKVITMDQVFQFLSKKQIPKGVYLAITFDDGYQDNYEHAFPVLKKLQLPAMIFLTTGYIGQNKHLWWDRLHLIMLTAMKEKIVLKLEDKKVPSFLKQQLQQIPVMDEQQVKQITSSFEKWLKNINERMKNEVLDRLEEQFKQNPSSPKQRMLNWEQIREMHQQGIDMGAHTVNHPILTRINLVEAEKEIKESQQQIKSKLGCPINHFAYPNGTQSDFNQEIINLLKGYDFHTACSTIEGSNHNHSELMTLKRKYIGNHPLPGFVRKLIK